MQWLVAYLVRFSSPWLAASAPWEEVRVAVEAPTARAARRAFRQGLRRSAKRAILGRHVSTRHASAPAQGELFAPR